MTVKLIAKVVLQEPMSLADLEQFVHHAKDIGVPSTRMLEVAVDETLVRITARA